MNRARLERIRELHALALEKDPADRATFLAEACGDDEGLRSEVESLLRAREGLGDFLERPASERLGVLLTEREVLAEGERVGRYEIVRVLGH